MNQLAFKTSTEPTMRFKWRKSSGEFVFVDDMDSGHLWHVLRMIWNHSMPTEARSTYYRHYKFNTFYTHEYMLAAIKAIASELALRDDVPAQYQMELAEFFAYLRRNQKQIES